MEYGNVPEFVWSLSCKLRAEFCRRQAVMHYREARRGALPEADNDDKRINQLHRVIPENKYIRQLLLRTMREIFYRGSDDPETLYVLALERLESDFKRMVFGDAPQVISTLFFHHSSVDSLRRNLRQMLWERCEKLQSGAWSGLLQIPVMQRRFISSPLKLYINELCCYASPLLAYSDRGRIRIVELRENDISAHPEILLMHRYYALNVSGRMPDSVVSCQLDPATGELRELTGDFSISATLKAMSAAAAYHREAMMMPLAEIPGRSENCTKCIFVSYCKNIN